MTGRFVAYYRVSTTKQGIKGPGMDAQRNPGMNYLNGGNWKLLADFAEVVTGKRSDRQELAKAVALCRQEGATLLIAKLDRLARNAAFLLNLRDSGVDFIATGQRPPNPSVLLEGERFGRLVRQLAKAYDLVLVDPPPILAVTDAALAASQASVALCVLRAGRHPMREVSTAIRRFAQGGVRIDGFVLNGVKLDRGLGVRNAYHYQYSYE